jgi:hypothetical protein
MIVSVRSTFSQKGSLKKSGDLIKLSGSVRPTWQKRSVFLGERCVVIMNVESDKENGRMHYLEGCEVFPILTREFGKEFVFEIVLSGRKKSLIFQAKDTLERSEWIVAINYREYVTIIIIVILC